MRIPGLFMCVALSAVVLIGCGGGSKSLQSTSECDIPGWYSTVPQDPNYLYAARTAVSQDMQLALDKALTDGRTEIGRQTELKVQGLQKRFDEEVGINTDAQLMSQFTQANKTVVSTSLTGSRMKSQELCKDGDMWRAYVLVEYPIGGTNEALLEQIKKNNEMHTRLRSSQTFKDLDKDVMKYEEWKKQQQAPPEEK
jgi:23S rRNA pseudoU1915 N3-methylase RlmH